MKKCVVYWLVHINFFLIYFSKINHYRWQFHVARECSPVLNYIFSNSTAKEIQYKIWVDNINLVPCSYTPIFTWSNWAHARHVRNWAQSRRVRNGTQSRRARNGTHSSRVHTIIEHTRAVYAILEHTRAVIRNIRAHSRRIRNQCDSNSLSQTQCRCCRISLSLHALWRGTDSTPCQSVPFILLYILENTWQVIKHSAQ